MTDFKKFGFETLVKETEKEQLNFCSLFMNDSLPFSIAGLTTYLTIKYLSDTNNRTDGDWKKYSQQIRSLLCDINNQQEISIETMWKESIGMKDKINGIDKDIFMWVMWYITKVEPKIEDVLKCMKNIKTH